MDENPSNPERAKINVIVCGGGIAGLTVALFLKTKGFSCQVFEVKEDKRTTTSGINLSPSGIRVLAELGLDGVLQERSQVIRRMRMLNTEGIEYASLEFKGVEQYGHDYLAMTRQVLHEVLMGKAREMHIPIRFGSKILSISQMDEGVVVSLADGTKVHGDLLIGADGIHSAVRHSLFPGLELNEKKKRGYYGCGAIVPLSYLDAEELSFLCLPEGSFNSINGSLGFVGFIGVGEGRFMFWTHIAEDNVPPEFDPRDLTQVKNILLSLRGSWCRPTRKAIELLDQGHADIEVICGPIVSLNPIPSWYEKRAILIGDAAHGFGPGAQGAAMAMEDASLLVRMMTECKENSTKAWSDVFCRFESKRRSRVEEIGHASEARNDQRLVDNGYFRTKINEYIMRAFGWWYRNGYYDAKVAYRVDDDM